MGIRLLVNALVLIIGTFDWARDQLLPAGSAVRPNRELLRRLFLVGLSFWFQVLTCKGDPDADSPPGISRRWRTAGSA